MKHLADIVIAAGFVAGSAERVLRRVRFAAADAAIVDRMRPHVIGRQEQAILKGAARVQLESMKGAVSDVATPGDRTACRIRRNAGRRIYEIHVIGCEAVRCFIPEVSGSAENIAGQLTLKRRGPGRDIVVFSIAIQIAGRNYASAGTFHVNEERRQRIRESWKRSVAERIALFVVEDWQVLVIFLSICVIYSGAESEHGIAMRPSNSDTRIYVVIARFAERSIGGTESAAGSEIEGNRPVVDLMEDVKEVIADSSGDRQIHRGFPLVLHVAPVLRLALPLQG